jgi:hypothetical protein
VRERKGKCCVSPTAVTGISFGLLMLLNVVLVGYVVMKQIVDYQNE